MGANLHDNSRDKFQVMLREAVNNVELPNGGKVDLPSDDIYDYTIDPKYNTFQNWDELKPEFKYNKAESFFNVLVPTADTVKYGCMLEKFTTGGYNVLVTGETGVGKSVVTKDFLNNAPENVNNATVNFSGKTTTQNLVNAFESKLEQRRRDVLGAKPGKRMIFFVDDVNMPQLDAGKAQPPCELLRQVIDQTGFYDTKKLFFKKVQDTRFVAACGPPGGGKNEVSPRLFRHFCMIWVPSLSKNAMQTIFGSILKGYFDLKGDPALSNNVDDIIRTGVDTYGICQEKFLPTPSKCHYTFNLRDLSKVIQGMLMCPLDDIVDKDYCVKLFACEMFRVFRDRLIDASDRKAFSEIMHKEMEAKLSLDWELSSFENVIFGDYEDSRNKQYIILSDTETLIPRLEELLMLYNAEQSPMNIVFFEDCIQHLTRISRTLRQERGNALCVGMGGSGRQSMARLGAGINDIKTVSIEITKSYKEREFHEDIKLILRKCGIDQETV